jgi:hypothetical protein
VEKQAEAAAVEQLAALELAATQAQALTPLQQMLLACGQPVSGVKRASCAVRRPAVRLRAHTCRLH